MRMWFAATARGARRVPYGLWVGGPVRVAIFARTRAMASTMSSMAPVSEQVHGNERHSKQYPDPVLC